MEKASIMMNNRDIVEDNKLRNDMDEFARLCDLLTEHVEHIELWARAMTPPEPKFMTGGIVLPRNNTERILTESDEELIVNDKLSNNPEIQRIEKSLNEAIENATIKLIYNNKVNAKVAEKPGVLEWNGYGSD